MDKIRHLFKDTSGVTATEYALLLGLVAIAIVTGATFLGTTLNQVLTNASTSFGS